MSGTPRIETLEAQPYVAVRGEVSAETFRDFVDSGFMRPFEWLGDQGIEPAGGPFIRYLALDENGDPSRIDLGVPVGERVDPGPASDVVGGELPAGRYATFLHVGPYEHAELADLGDASKGLVAWAERQGIDLAKTETPDGTDLGGSFEFYLVDPMAEPDFAKWQTRIVMLVEG